MNLPQLVPIEEMSAAAQFLNQFFQRFDYKILEFYNNLRAGPAGGVLDFFFKYFTRLGDKGAFLILLGLIFLLFRKTRKVGFGMLGGLLIGALFTNITIKPIIARPRPYMTTEVYRDWWLAVSHGLESEFSFPSGHTTSAMAAATPVFLFCDKKKSWLVFLFVILMGASRNYIFVHFPSDILGGIIIGGLAGLISYFIFKAVYNKVKPESRFCAFDLAEKIKK